MPKLDWEYVKWWALTTLLLTTLLMIGIFPRIREMQERNRPPVHRVIYYNYFD